MRMIKDNVERITDSPEQIAKLKSNGFRELQGSGKTEPEKVNPDKALENMTLDELKALAKEKGLDGYSSLAKGELLDVLKDVI